MANKVRVRVEVNFKRVPYNASSDDRKFATDQAVRLMRLAFKRRCEDYGIKHAFKEHEYFESKPRKDRRKRKEAELRRLKEEEFEKRGGRTRRDDGHDDRRHKGHHAQS